MATKMSKSQIIQKLRHDANKALEVCKSAESDQSITAEELEKRISKMGFMGLEIDTDSGIGPIQQHNIK